MPPTLDQVLTQLQAHASEEWLQSIARAGIRPQKAYGMSMGTLIEIAKGIGTDHPLALELWDTGIYEARMLAAMVDDPEQVTEEQMERWVGEIDNWAVCDSCCGKLFDRTPYAYPKAAEWCRRPEEFVRRAGFSMIAALALHDKKAPDEEFDPFFSLVLEAATDERNYVKKAVNWALRQLGKRNLPMNAKAIALARQMECMEDKTARWNAKDALRELTSDKIQERLKRQAAKSKKR